MKEKLSGSIFLLLHACAEKAKRFVAHKDNKRFSGLTINQMEILQFICRNGEISIGSLSDELRVYKSALSQSVAGLVRRGYLKKSRGNKDGRTVMICGTKKLKGITKKIDRIIEKHVLPVFEGLSERDKKSLHRLLSIVYEGLERELS